MLILADLVAPGRCPAAGLQLGIATRHPGVWSWQLGPYDRAQEINATTCHCGYCLSRGLGRSRRRTSGLPRLAAARREGAGTPYSSSSALSASSSLAMAACA